jgi:hypothetical protein
MTMLSNSSSHPWVWFPAKRGGTERRIEVVRYENSERETTEEASSWARADLEEVVVVVFDLDDFFEEEEDFLVDMVAEEPRGRGRMSGGRTKQEEAELLKVDLRRKEGLLRNHHLPISSRLFTNNGQSHEKVHLLLIS